MKERPILLSGPMIRALLSGAKTQTRRVVKLPRGIAHSSVTLSRMQCGYPDGSTRPVWELEDDPNAFSSIHPYGQPGDRLWVRETWRADDYAPNDPTRTIYRADMPAEVQKETQDVIPWRPSIFMPRTRSRITLEIVSVGVERVQDISEEDAIAEGMFFADYGLDCFHVSAGVRLYDPAVCPAPVAYHNQRAGWSWHKTSSHEECLYTALSAFANLWNSINDARGFGWDANPWVWKIAFRRLEQP